MALAERVNTGRSVDGIFSDLYHTESELIQEYKSVGESCSGLFELWEGGAGSTLPLPWVRIRGHGGDKRASNDSNLRSNSPVKILFFFSEHANELITAEVGLQTIRKLCAHAGNLLDQVDILTYPIVDASGRRLLESKHNYCQRKDGLQVDLNRNWDAHWRPGYPSAEDYGGTQPFSQTETVALRDSVATFSPDVFIDVHSGTLGLYTPLDSMASYPHDEHGQIPESISASKMFFKQLNPRYCNCPAGSAGAVSGYLAYGTAQDYMFESANVEYSFVVEVFDGDQNAYMYPPQRARHHRHVKQAVLARGRRLNHSSSTEISEGERQMGCFKGSNPSDRETFDATKSHWSDALVEMVQWAAKQHHNEPKKSKKNNYD